MINFTVRGNKMDFYDLNNKLKVAQETSFIFVHINKTTIKIYSHQRNIRTLFFKNCYAKNASSIFLNNLTK